MGGGKNPRYYPRYYPDTTPYLIKTASLYTGIKKGSVSGRAGLRAAAALRSLIVHPEDIYIFFVSFHFDGHFSEQLFAPEAFVPSRRDARGVMETRAGGVLLAIVRLSEN